MTRSSDFGDSTERELQSMPRLPIGQNSPAADIDPTIALMQVMLPRMIPSPSNLTMSNGTQAPPRAIHALQPTLGLSRTQPTATSPVECGRPEAGPCICRLFLLAGGQEACLCRGLRSGCGARGAGGHLNWLKLANSSLTPRPPRTLWPLVCSYMLTSRAPIRTSRSI